MGYNEEYYDSKRKTDPNWEVSKNKRTFHKGMEKARGIFPPNSPAPHHRPTDPRI